jgi:hypothetical protein
MQRKTRPGFLQICATLLLTLLVILHSNSDARAFSPNEDCLWISYGERLPGKKNEIVTPIKINFGRFPNRTKELQPASGLMVYLFINDGSGNSEWSRRTLDLGKRDRDGFIAIKTGKGDHVLIYAVTELLSGGNTIYSAKSNFMGHSGKPPLTSVDPTSATADPVDLDITPRFHYWRQVGAELKIIAKTPHPRGLYVLDEHAAPARLTLDKNGATSYLLPDDGILNEQGAKAVKTAIVVAEKMERDQHYVATYSLPLHRNRFMHRHYRAGLAIIGGTVILSLAVVMWRRKETEL